MSGPRVEPSQPISRICTHNCCTNTGWGKNRFTWNIILLLGFVCMEKNTIKNDIRIKTVFHMLKTVYILLPQTVLTEFLLTEPSALSLSLYALSHLIFQLCSLTSK